MARFKLTIEYDGTDFVGWQRQDNGLGVQQVVEEAVKGFCGETVTVHVAGRTDAGVHALGQVAHFDLGRDAAPDTVRDALNFHMKAWPVSIIAAEEVPGGDDGFHARFTARERAYLYRITNRRAPLALNRNRTWWVPFPLDADAMDKAAKVLIGRHDFTSFRAAQCQAESPVKTLDVLDVERSGEELHVRARARSFLHHQVRNLVGTLKLVGEGKWTADDVRRALDARDRSAAGPTAPAAGLYLVEVLY
ncbi:MAG: tRNA pseudouridine(38-40) synthase TruA [Rhodospirillales bacterium]|nr:tRNA pseudouridine(38-40) synthase TruA [Rhodospirillales bacterium]MCW8862470.1 tRNA pseudouridine(38-40) synthase TruA [Rhodospirillales bacterium]MCW9001403.1 tRNA pseudouridine(38-40) synthase TruA [Rhodospirillales bacterium]